MIDRVKCTCPQCGLSRAYLVKLMGKTVNCPRCAHRFGISTRLRVGCPYCAERVRLRPEALGTSVTCRRCSGTFVAPLPDTTPEASDHLPAVSDSAPPPAPVRRLGTLAATPVQPRPSSRLGQVSRAPALPRPAMTEIDGLTRALEMSLREQEWLRAERDQLRLQVESLRAILDTLQVGASSV